MKKAKPHLYLPIEILVRELNSKIFLSLKASLKGYRVYLGTKKGIDRILDEKIKTRRSGIYFNKSQIVQNRKYIQKIKKTCESFIVSDEELGTGVYDIKECLKERAVFAEDTEKFFLIGKKMLSNIKKYSPNFYNISKVTGWLKYELYKKKNIKIFKKEVAEIKKEYGSFYLFSSNLGTLSADGLNYRIKAGQVKKSNTKRIMHFKKSIKTFQLIKDEFNSKSKKINIVIRPHPSDAFHSDWYRNINQNRSLKIVFDKDIVPWIIASKGLIHRGCSTAVDAVLLNKPTFYLKSKRKFSTNENTLPSRISHKINSLNDLLYIKKKIGYNIFKNFLSKEIYNIENNNSADKILEEIEKLKITKELPVKIDYYKNMKTYFRFYITTFIKLFFKNNVLDFKSSGKFNKKIICDKISLLSKNKKLLIREVSVDVFEIEKK